ncbi:MAG: cob(I)yrinic acid a,c-diamide adenosyltransferase [Bacillaceae bacterium]
MKIYTRTGDLGQTSLVGARTWKDNVRVSAYGTTDEANSFIGLAMTFLQGSEFEDIYRDLEGIQHELFDCGGDLAIVKGTYPYKVDARHVEVLEKQIDTYMEQTPPLRRFILPGGSTAASYLHIARTIVRRAEREVVALKKEEEINVHVLTYLNRLSDLLFVLARVVNVRQRVNDIEYVRGGNVFKTED